MGVLTGRTNADFKLFKSVGSVPYTNTTIVAARGICNSEKWELLSNSDDIRDLPYFYYSVADYFYFASESNDDALGGIGANTVAFAAIDENYELVFGTVELNGQTPVQTSSKYLRIFEILITSFGNNVDSDTGDSVPVGNIWVGIGDWTNGVPDTKLIGIGAGNFYNDPDSREGIYTVPTDVIGAVRSINVTMDRQNLPAGNRRGFVLQIAIKPPGFDFFLKYSPFYVQDNILLEPEISILPSRTDFQIRVLGFDTRDKDIAVEIGIELINVE